MVKIFFHCVGSSLFFLTKCFSYRIFSVSFCPITEWLIWVSVLLLYSGSGLLFKFIHSMLPHSYSAKCYFLAGFRLKSLNIRDFAWSIEESQLAKRHIGNWSTSLDTREMLTITTSYTCQIGYRNPPCTVYAGEDLEKWECFSLSFGRENLYNPSCSKYGKFFDNRGSVYFTI